MHRWMVPIAAVGTVGLTLLGQNRDAALAGLVYGLGSVGLYAVSALAHHKIWEPARLHFLFRLDQSMIMAFIAASTVPVAYAIGGGTGWLLALGMLAGTSVGVALIWAPFHPPRGFTNALFLLVAWWPVFFISRIADGLGSTGLALLLAGAAVYTLGAFVVGSQLPNPDPEVFGYHEIWHVFVICANVLHAVMVALIVSGNL